MTYLKRDKSWIKDVARQVLATMSQWDISLTPENYFVWFHYIAGEPKELVCDVRRIIEEGGKFSAEINDKLYQKYFGVDSALIAETQKEIMSIVRDVLDQLLYSQDYTSEYRQKLEGFTRQLQAAKGIDEVHDIVACLMKATVDVIKAGEELKANLEETASKSEKFKNELEKAQIEILSDSLTALYNRRAFDRKIESYMQQFGNGGAVFSIVMLDIDHFKLFNDQHGHLLGDHVLKFMGNLLTQELKGKDFVARYGGEEFIILMENTFPEDAYIVADKIRKSLNSVHLKYVKTGQVLGRISISAGVAAVRSGDTVESLVKRVDDALYLAKRSGRNCVKAEWDLFDRQEQAVNAPLQAVEFLEQ